MTQPLTAAGFLDRLKNLNVWRRANERAPHKPLLLLHALARIERGEPRLMRFEEVEGPMTQLLLEFGPSTKPRPEYPFCRLKGDGVWQVFWPFPFHVREGIRKDPSPAELKEAGVEAGFTAATHELLASDPALRRKATALLLDMCYPATVHEDLLAAVELDAEWESVQRRVRDPAFRARVLSAWGHRCGICGFDVRLRDSSIALDAAHIQWKQARGPDVAANGMALCALHHRLFDRGAFTLVSETAASLDDPIRVIVSKETSGGTSLESALYAFHDRPLEALPQPDLRPAEQHLAWHRSQVFRGEGAGGQRTFELG